MVEHEGLPMKAVYQKKPEFEQDVERDDESKTRKCLVCKAPFLSGWAGERICRKCKSKSNWRMG
jgi:hypothetical protein